MLADVPLVGVEERAAQRVQLLALAELAADSPAELLVAQPGEDEVRVDQPPYSCSARASGLLWLPAWRRFRSSGAGAHPRRSEAASRRVVPVRGDQLGGMLVLEKLGDPDGGVGPW